jgi:hypothetical protein
VTWLDIDGTLVPWYRHTHLLLLLVLTLNPPIIDSFISRLSILLKFFFEQTCCNQCVYNPLQFSNSGPLLYFENYKGLQTR